MSNFKNANLKAVLWDMDGTLADTLPDILDVFNRLLAEYDHPPLTERELVSHFGPPEEEILKKLLPELSRVEIERQLRRYAENGSALSCFDGILDLLAQIDKVGMKNGVFTGAGTIFGGARMKRLDLNRWVGAFVCADDVQKTKPAPDGLLELCRRLSVDPGETIYIGDSPLDAQSAKAAGIPFVAVAWGVNPVALLQKEEPLAVVHDRDALKDILLGAGR